ncbi:FAD-dependent oxidoreductase [Rubripirellula obstinata]|uniref:FAD-dependent oxidoreductase n=1 Tax=Rubripirellula obstinata TaxID=406547 RepID=UPI000A00A4C0|nr:FAD-dependent oxidoreductase [Rubripirellula obstinata]
MNRRRVVLLGIGHTNAHIVKQWATDPIPNCDLVCISNHPTATYSGMLPGTLGWQFDDNEMRIDLASLAADSGAEFVIADTIGLDLSSGDTGSGDLGSGDLGSGKLSFSDREPIAFDALSIGVGSVPGGWQQHAESPLLVPVKPMQTFLQRLDDRLAQCMDKTKPHKVAIVGGGVASVEIGFCLLQQCQKRKLDHDFSIEIFTSGKSIAQGMAPRSIRRLQRLLTSRGIKIVTGYRVTEVDDDGVMTDDGIHHAADAVIWATGAAAPPVLSKLGLQTDDRGFIATNQALQSLSDPRIFAVGDSGTMIESPSPKAGVYAVRQCPILWHNLRAFLSDGTLREFVPQDDFLKILNTGDGKAFLQYGWFTAHARWCWELKTWIDRRFIQEYQVPRQEPSL